MLYKPLYILLILRLMISNIYIMIKEISKHIRTRQIVVRKDHSAFRGANYCAQIVRRIKNATSYLIQHNPVDNKKIMSHSDADKWLKKNNSELYTKLPSAIAQRSTAHRFLAKNGRLF